MKFLYKLEKKYGHLAIRNLSAYVVGCWAIGYLLWMFAPKVYELLIFDVSYVFVGHQFWRIFTWIFTMPGPVDVFTILMLFIYFSLGGSIERHVGTFLYNLYIFGAFLFITIGMLVDGLISYMNNAGIYKMFYAGIKGYGYGQDALEALAGTSPTYFMSISVFLGFALIFSEAMMLLFFVFPIKAKWLAYVDLIILAYYFIKYGEITLLKGIILAVVFNFYLFYLISKNYTSFRKRSWLNTSSSETLKRQKEFKKKMTHAQMEKSEANNVSRHKCAICGRTEKDDEDLEFRFCSRCNGNYEYCNEHLFTHEHVK